jgi:hypothetical protein
MNLNKKLLLFSIILLALFISGCFPPPQIKMNLEVGFLTDELLVEPTPYVTNPREGFHKYNKDDKVLLSVNHEYGYGINSWIIYDSNDNFIGEFDNEYNLKMDNNYRAIANLVCNSDDVCIDDYVCVNNECLLDNEENINIHLELTKNSYSINEQVVLK